MNDSPITTPFGAQTTAAQVVAGVDLAGRRAVVTGAGVPVVMKKFPTKLPLTCDDPGPYG